MHLGLCWVLQACRRHTMHVRNINDKSNECYNGTMTMTMTMTTASHLADYNNMKMGSDTEHEE